MHACLLCCALVLFIKPLAVVVPYNSNSLVLTSTFLDDYNAMKSCLDTYVKTGKTDTPHKGRGHRLPVKNTRFESAHEESDDDGDDASPVKKVC